MIRPNIHRLQLRFETRWIWIVAYCCWRVIHGINSSNIYVCISMHVCMQHTYVYVCTFISKKLCRFSELRLIQKATTTFFTNRRLEIQNDANAKNSCQFFIHFLYCFLFLVVLSVCFIFVSIFIIVKYIVLIIVSFFLSKLSFWHLHSFWISWISRISWIISKKKLIINY